MLSEPAAFDARKEHCDTALRRLLIAARPDAPVPTTLPTVALCTSGGGPRAFLCTVAFLDALARRGLLDVFAYHACLSGSSWAVASWFASPSPTCPNVFAPRSVADPWATPPESSPGELDLGRIKAMISTPFLKRLAKEVLMGHPLKFWESHLRATLLEPFHGSQAATLRLQNLRQADLAAGAVPIPVCTCIADGTPPDKWDWVGFTPFGAQRLGKHHTAVTKSWAALSQYSLSDLMAVWGSAFAFDWESAPEALRKLGAAKYNDPYLPFGNAASMTLDDPVLGRLRDAGIASNIPLPVLLKSVSGRPVSVCVVMDASELGPGETDCVALWRLRDVLPWLNDAEVNRPFGPDEVVRAFVPPVGCDDPIILYVMGYTSKSSTDTNYSDAEIDAVFRYMSTVAQALTPVLLRAVVNRASAETAAVAPTTSTNVASSTTSAAATLFTTVMSLNDSASMTASLLSAFYRATFTTMGILTPPGAAGLLPFHSTYTPVTSSADGLGQGRRGASETSHLLQLKWPTPPAGTRNLWVIVGTAGVGKTTLSLQLARDQASIVNRTTWPFEAIVRVSCHVLAGLLSAAGPNTSMDVLIAAAAYHDPSHAKDGASPTSTGGVDGSGANSAPAAGGGSFAIDPQLGWPEDPRVASLASILRTTRCLIVFDGFDEAQFDPRMQRIASRFFNRVVAPNDEWASDVLLTTRPQHDPMLFASATLNLALNAWSTAELRCYVDNYARACPFLDVERANALLGRSELASLAGTPLMTELLCHMVASSVGEATVTARAALAYSTGCLMERRPPAQKATLSNVALLDRLQRASVDWHRNAGRWDFLLDPTSAVDQAVMTSGFVRIIGRDMGEHGRRLRAAMVHQTIAEYLVARHICVSSLAYIDTGITLGKLDEVVLACLADPQFTITEDASPTAPPRSQPPLPPPQQAMHHQLATTSLSSDANGSLAPSATESFSSYAPPSLFGDEPIAATYRPPSTTQSAAVYSSPVVTNPSSRAVLASPKEIRVKLQKRFVAVITELLSPNGPNADFSVDLDRNGAAHYGTRAKWRDRLRIDRVCSFIAATNDAELAKAVLDAFIPSSFMGNVTGAAKKRGCLAPLLSEAAAANGAMTLLDLLRQRKLLDSQRAVLEAQSNQNVSSLRNLLRDQVAPSIEMAEACGNSALIASLIESKRHPISGALPDAAEAEISRVALNAAVRGRLEHLPTLLQHCGNGACLTVAAALCNSGHDPWSFAPLLPRFDAWLKSDQASWVPGVLDAMRHKAIALTLPGCDVTSFASLAGQMSTLQELEFIDGYWGDGSPSAASQIAAGLGSLPLAAVRIQRTYPPMSSVVPACRALAVMRRLIKVEMADVDLSSSEASAAMAESLRGLQSLRLTYCSLDDRAAPSLALVMQGSPDLTQLDLSHNSLGNGAGATLGLALRSCAMRLSRLNLSFNPFASGGMMSLCQGLVQTQWRALQALSFAGCRIDANGSQPVATVILAVKALLTQLDLSDNPLLGASFAMVNGGPLTAALRDCKTLRALQLRNVGLPANGAVAIGSILRDSGRLQRLDLSDNPLFADEGLRTMAAAATVPNRPLPLESFRIRGCSVSPAGASDVKSLQMLSLLPSLALLDVSVNPLGDTGLRVLAVGLPKLPRLSTLRMHDVGCTDIGLRAVADALRSAASFDVLHAERNLTTPEVAVQVAEMLPNASCHV